MFFRQIFVSPMRLKLMIKKHNVGFGYGKLELRKILYLTKPSGITRPSMSFKKLFYLQNHLFITKANLVKVKLFTIKDECFRSKTTFLRDS